MIDNYDVAIIGSGPAGYSAAIYTIRGGLSTALIQGYQVGGQLTTTTDVENYPGFGEPIQGPWLMSQMCTQAERLGANTLFEQCLSFEAKGSGYIVSCDSGLKIFAKVIVIATGAQAKWLGLESEKKFLGYGVSSCATCDGFFFKDKSVIVVGGGNTAAEEAIYLTNHASKVYLVHRRDKLRSEKVLQERLFSNPKVEIIWNHVLDEICGSEDPKQVTYVNLKSTVSNEFRKLDVQGVFIAIGHSPNTSIFKGLIDIDDEGYIITSSSGSTHTNLPGVFASGDVQDKVYRQAITAAGTGCMAAIDAIKYIQSNVFE